MGASAVVYKASASSDTVSVQCPALKTAIGGGGSINTSTKNLVFDGPIDANGAVPADGSPATGWKVTYSGTATVTAYVICVP